VLDPKLPEATWQRIKTALQAGGKLEAIKIYREETGLGLKESKDAIDSLEAELRRTGGMPAKAAKTGCFTVFVLGAGLSWLLLR
jgi:ribosomal protein L7/L12